LCHPLDVRSYGSAMELDGAATKPLWERHLAILVTAVPLALTLVRIARVSRFNEATAYALLAHGSPLAIIGGSVMGLVPIELVVLSLALVVWCWNAPAGSRATVRWITPVVVLPVVAFVPVDALLSVGGVAALIGGSMWWSKREGESVRFNWPVALLGGALVASILTLLGADKPWLPAEEVRVHGHHAVVGYVLDGSERWTTLMIDSTRRVMIVPTNEITNRSLCTLSPGGFWYDPPSMRDLFTGDRFKDPLPTCRR
jgi:hypothetical protein